VSQVYTTRKRHVAAGRVAATVSNTTRQYETAWHAHDEYMILLPRSGGLVVRIEGQGGLIRLNAGTFTVVAPGLVHATAATRAQQQHLALYIAPRYAAQCAAQVEGAQPDRLPASGAWRLSPALQASLRLREELAQAARRGTSTQLEALDRLLAAEALAVALTTPSVLPSAQVRDAMLLHDIQAYIEAHLAEHLGLEDIAAQFLLSRRHLSRLFRERAGMSVVEFINRRRVARAQSLLSDPATTVLDAALAVGIESPSYLARLFRTYAGHLPNRRG
jgi:AraC-like DNA-binding protein